MHILCHSSRHGPLFALIVLNTHVRFGCAIPQGDIGTGPVAVDLEVSALPLGDGTRTQDPGSRLLNLICLRLHFNTRKFLGFIGAYDAITFGRDMYIVADYSLSPKPGPKDFNFQGTMSTIVHEIRHCQQYRSLGWVIPAFGAKYMYQYCRAGFKYRTLKFEAEAYAQDKMMDDLLYDPYGYIFFRYWNFRKLSSVLGYPVATTYRRQPGASDETLWELPFQYGILLVKYYKDGACWSYLTTAEADAREKANSCRSFSGRCEPDTTIYEKALARRDCLKDEKLR